MENGLIKPTMGIRQDIAMNGLEKLAIRAAWEQLPKDVVTIYKPKQDFDYNVIGWIEGDIAIYQAALSDTCLRVKKPTCSNPTVIGEIVEFTFMDVKYQIRPF